MSKCVTSMHLNSGARELFCHIAVPDVFWSSVHLSLISVFFYTVDYPQNNRKAEATIKGMKNHLWSMEGKMRINCARPCYSIAQQEKGYHQLKNFSAVSCRIHYQPIPGHFPTSGSIVQKKQNTG